MNLNQETQNKAFDYRFLRLLIGIIAFAMPIIVWIFSTDELLSISASYYTNMREIFTGSLFIVGAFLMAYNGHSFGQLVLSKIASVSIVLIALFPTECKECSTEIIESIRSICQSCSIDNIAKVHYASAGISFFILGIFCVVFFRKRIDQKVKERMENGGHGITKREVTRKSIYLLCGLVIFACIIILFVTGFILDKRVIAGINVFFWTEAIALWSFGLSWFIAGKALSLIVDDYDRYYPMRPELNLD